LFIDQFDLDFGGLDGRSPCSSRFIPEIDFSDAATVFRGDRGQRVFAVISKPEIRQLRNHR
jgi:hypothetical protein